MTVVNFLFESKDLGEDMMCTECKAPLSYVSISDGRSGYFHFSVNYDTHLPVLSPQRESLSTVFFCDFCNTKHTEHELGTVYTEEIDAIVGTSDMTMSNDWAVCKDCLAFIQANDWTGLIERNWEVNQEEYNTRKTSKQEFYDFIIPLYALVSSGITKIDPPKESVSG